MNLRQRDQVQLVQLEQRKQPVIALYMCFFCSLGLSLGVNLRTSIVAAAFVAYYKA